MIDFYVSWPLFSTIHELLSVLLVETPEPPVPLRQGNFFLADSIGRLAPSADHMANVSVSATMPP